MIVTMNMDNAGPKAVSAQPVNSKNVIAVVVVGRCSCIKAGVLVDCKTIGKRQRKPKLAHILCFRLTGETIFKFVWLN